MFLRYWDAASATSARFVKDWLLTGDLGYADEDGFLHFVSRKDDVITSAGYRIGPGEIEECLSHHPAVHSAAVVGVVDRMKTEVVAAFVVLRDSFTPSDALVEELKDHVSSRLGHYLRPRLVRFIDELPLTATGKIMRSKLRELVL
jgi:acetyl-CoA synthetase